MRRTALSGTVDAESVGGKITLEGGRGRVQLSTVEGDIAVNKAGGEIVAESVATQEGCQRIVETIPDNSSATFSVRTFGDNRLDSTLPLKQGSNGRRGQRATYTLGGGAAQVDVEAFDGSVRIRRIGEKN